MIKKTLRLLSLMIFGLCLSIVLAVAEENPVSVGLSLAPGESWDCGREDILWQSDAPQIVGVEDSVFVARELGIAILDGLDAEGNAYRYEITVVKEQQKMPQLMQQAVDLALSEWEALGGSRLARCNKYTLWYSNGNKYEYGWCAAFECYCLYHVGIPMVEWTACTEHPDGDVWGVKANGVGKVIEGYNKMNRLTFTPRPGYLVVYGQKDSGNSMHVGIVTDVQELSEGRYLVKTVEGNMSNTIKRYCYLYEVGTADESRANGKANYSYGVYGNYSDCPEEYRTEPETYQYTIHKKNWYVFRFCATWF